MQHEWYFKSSPCYRCQKEKCTFTCDGFLNDNGGCRTWNDWGGHGWANIHRQGMQAIQQRDLKRNARKL